MINQRKIGIMAITMVALALLVMGCPSPSSPQREEGKGTVLINFGGGNVRTILPSEIDLPKLHYVITFTNEGGGTITETQNGSSPATFQLAVGMWNLVIRGYNTEADASNVAKALVYYTQNGINVSFGGNVIINAILLPNLDNLTQDGSGTLRYEITFPTGAAGVLKLNTYPANMQVGSTIILTSTVNDGEMELDSGFYYINVTIENGGKVQIWDEIIHISDNAITEAIVGPDDFTDTLPPPGTVDIYLSMDKFTMTDEAAGVFDGVPPIMLVKGLDIGETIAADGLVVVAWRVGDTVLGTGSTVTLHPSFFPVGIYTLNLVFVKDGKPWLGSLVFEVDGLDAIQVMNTAQWESALTTIRNGGNNKTYIINIIGDVAVSGITDVDACFGWYSNNITVVLTGSGRLYLNSQGSIIRLGNGQTLIIDSEYLTLQGLRNGYNGSNQDNNNPVLYIQDGATLELKKGTITGNASSSYGGGVYSSGAFTMSGGEISGNTSSGSSWGGAGVFASSFTMSGGIISGNTSSVSHYYYGGGGVCVYGTFTMSGGEISGNAVTSSSGGGVWASSIIMSGGEIIGNTAANCGGGVYVENNISTISGNSKINGNTANSGGGVYVYSNGGIGTLIMNGNAEISGNAATYSGGGVCLDAYGQIAALIMHGGKISGNIASSYGGGVYATRRAVFDKHRGGIIFGYTSGDTDSNTVKDNSDNVQSNRGHAVYIDGFIPRDTTLSENENITLLELNDTGWEDAELLVINNWTEYITESTGVQWFKFTATSNIHYIHAGFGDTFTPGAPVRPAVHVYDSSFNLAGFGELYRDYSSYFSLTVTAGQMYYVRVMPYYSSLSDTYRIAINTSATAP